MDTHKMDGNSLSPQAELLELFKTKCPEIFTESKIDIDKLRKTLGEEITDDTERYGLSWAGKSDCFRHIQELTTATLKPMREESLDFDNTENIFIEGDNLQVLKVLQKSYYGKIKMIYIDPPYNTGKSSFIYPDRFKEEKEEYLERVGDKDVEGNLIRDGFFRKNTKDAGHFHSNWLSMIYPRLFLAHNLLKQDGVIFVSIDDNEVHNLRMVMNEIFGEDNFVACFTWETKKGAQGMQTQNMIVANHEYIIVYAREREQFAFLGEERTEEGFSNPDNDPRGPWKRQYLQRFGQNLPERTIVNPENGMKFTFETPYTVENMNTWISEGRIIFPDKADSYPARKEFLLEYKTEKQLITALGLHATKATTEKLYDLFDGTKIFTNPKPNTILQYLAKVTTERNDIIVDFFAGSCTIAQAVMELNAEDGGNRKYICVQLAEPCDAESEAYKAGYKTIADIGKERIRRAAKKIAKGNKSKLDFDKTKIDLGFKVFKLDESNFKIWRSDVKIPKELETQIGLFVDNLKSEATQENILYELILKSGLDLNVPIEKKKSNGKQYFLVDEGNLIICLEDKLTQKLVDTILKIKPEKCICLDKSFSGNDQLKTNTALQMESEDIDFKVI